MVPSSATPGHGKALGRRGGAVLRISAAGDKGAQGIARLPAGNAVAATHYRAGNLQTRNVGDARRRPVMSLALDDVGAVDPGRLHADQHLAQGGPGPGPGGRRQHLGTAEAGDFDAGHGFGKVAAHRALPLSGRGA